MMCCQKVDLACFIQVRLLRFMLTVVFMMESFLMDFSINICSVLLTELGREKKLKIEKRPSLLALTTCSSLFCNLFTDVLQV